MGGTGGRGDQACRSGEPAVARGAAGLLPRSPGRVQGAGRVVLRCGISAHRIGEDPEVPDPGGRRGRADHPCGALAVAGPVAVVAIALAERGPGSVLGPLTQEVELVRLEPQ